MDKQAQRDLEELLARDMDGVAVPPPPVARPTDVARRWDLPARDVEALMRWGLPLLNEDGELPSHLPSADFQSELLPQLDLSVPTGGPFDPEHHRGVGLSAYRLAASDWLTYGVVRGEGSVCAIRNRTSAATALVNTSVAAFVECSWRWWRALDIIGPLEDEDDETYWWCLERFAEWSVGIDPQAKVRSPVEQSWWESVALS
ncbi:MULTISPECIES: SUKH-4 family immunity protein [Streptomyces]|uniref:SUKH-4 family immunity protein n=1 Tax=Streptomyces solicathayae TaxID=3081768 RepID=A0ABZ0LT17_9ACTN|nr:SUKH-4 family immunity protein [Streptomyces sp. HUAS YS2]WOX22341.1 SUKH-4 family immunity protein [Streptomyces sp. HUAS YS2]